MIRRPVLRALTLVAGVALAVTSVMPAAAKPLTPNRDRYAAVGDSYAAGVGADGVGYPVLLAGRANKVTYLAESGATTSDVMQQIAMVPMTANQITLTVGGNDIGFADIALTCAPDPTSIACQTALAGVPTSLGELASSLPVVIAQLQAAAPYASIYVTGYPALFQPAVALDPCPALPGMDPAVLAGADDLVAQLNGVIAAVAAGTGEVYVDVTDEFAGYGLCTMPGTLINAPTIDPTTGTWAESSLHPTAMGQAAYTQALLDEGFVGR